jgi:hypothetical protein
VIGQEVKFPEPQPGDVLGNDPNILWGIVESRHNRNADGYVPSRSYESFEIGKDEGRICARLGSVRVGVEMFDVVEK